MEPLSLPFAYVAIGLSALVVVVAAVTTTRPPPRTPPMLTIDVAVTQAPLPPLSRLFPDDREPRRITAGVMVGAHGSQGVKVHAVMIEGRLVFRSRQCLCCN